VAGAGLTLEEILGGCATVRFKETAPVIYPPLKGHKVQPPENGCFVGFFRHSATFGYPVPIEAAVYYEEKLDKKPSILVAFRQYLPIFYPGQSSETSAKKGIIPIVYAAVDLSQFTNIPKGKYDDELKQAAEGAVQYGEKYGGFFITPMWEMNMSRSYAHQSQQKWCEQPGNFKKVWRHIWQIFEYKGANKYTTWAIEYHVDFSLQGYWPGDQYVDWIGLSGFNRKVEEKYYGYRHLDDLFKPSYSYFRRKHQHKPIMLSEFGTTIAHDQQKWLIKAFETIKSMPGIKAATYWDNFLDNYDDHTLSTESLNTLKEILKDPYFIMAK
jgi:hypothetical protein